MSWQRARTDEQIEQRIDEIVQATERLFERYAYDEITFVMIAREADFTRSNLYKYFRTTEEVLLEILMREMTNWRIDVEKSLRGRSWTVQEFSRAWMASLKRHRRMMKLFSIMNTTIEKNSTLEKLIEFKRHAMVEWGGIGVVLAGIFRFRSEESVMQFVYAQLAFVIGASPIWEMTENQKKAMEVAGVMMSEAEMEGMFVGSIESLLRGVIVA
ncbi:Bacterial regulatory protein, tetR family [Poriferisphaera corsica]|uniref:Bacterial regulatory protein, tetR family n=1 Tax=Poriferisphaera corsica TaxID=2528020 RepID=A0A517YYN0_9BACT|nr:TetR family transcriptional regulator [Poriferisphaera corsica]QDU35340.1 Bacterial regulatory protein, tetR family [Poriferisphaera corsica]